MSRMTRLISTLGALCAMLALGIASAQSSTSSESKTLEVLAVSGNTVVAKGPDGTKEYNLPPDIQMDMDGKPITVSDLKPGMTVHVTTTTKVSTHKVVTTEVKDGEVMAVRAYSVIMKTDQGYQQFTPERLKNGDVMLFRDGQEIHLSELKKGDKVSAMIVTTHPPNTVTEKQVMASAKAAPMKEHTKMAHSGKPSNAAPAAEKTAASAPASESAAPAEKKLPKTASPLPGIALLGFLALASGAALGTIRRFGSAR